MKTLEENRYKRLVNADCRRIAWFVNNSMSEDYDTMPESMRKKWVKAEYKKERYMAKKFLEGKKQNESIESKVRHIIREILSEAKPFTTDKLFKSMKDIPQEKQLNLKKWYKLGFTKKEILKMFKDKQKKGELNLESVLKSLMEGKMIEIFIQEKDLKNTLKVLKQANLKIEKDFDIGLNVGMKGIFPLEIDKKHYDDVLELLIKNNIKVKS